jgi:DNA-binding response OmpR family regulator
MKILVVDDDATFLELMGNALRGRGHHVFLARDGREGRELLEVERVDLILSDVYMPTLDGVMFHSYVREFSDSPEVPFLFMSGYSDEYTRDLVVDSDRDFFLPKTTALEKVLSKIADIGRSRKIGSSTKPA